MPCNSDYMNATNNEVNLSIVFGLLDELQTGILPKDFGNGYDKRAYCHYEDELLDVKTEELCNHLQGIDVSGYSLEMQMWWRDHQKADKKRVSKELFDLIKEADKKIALSKLSQYEKDLLGID